MRPNTVHYVLTVNDSIVYGRHLFPVKSMQSTVSGIIHTFILNYTVTNTLHDSTLHTMLRRMMAMWTINSKLNNPATGRHSHTPNICTVSGLMEFMTLGKLLECSQILDRRAYNPLGIHGGDLHEIATSRWRFRRILAEFANHWITTVGDKIVAPWSLFLRMLVEFAAAIVVYKRNTAPKTERKKTGCTKDALWQKMVDFFSANYPEVLPHLHKLVADKFQFFYWTGPAIGITSREVDDEMPLDFDDKLIFPPSEMNAEQAVIVSQMVETGANNDTGTGIETNIGSVSKATETQPNKDIGSGSNTDTSNATQAADIHDDNGVESDANTDTGGIATGKRSRASSGTCNYLGRLNKIA